MTKKTTLTAVDVPVVRCPTCDVPYILRFALHWNGEPPEWVYQKDCKHKARSQQVDVELIEWASLAVVRPTGD